MVGTRTNLSIHTWLGWPGRVSRDQRANGYDGVYAHRSDGGSKQLVGDVGACRELRIQRFGRCARSHIDGGQRVLTPLGHREQIV